MTVTVPFRVDGEPSEVELSNETARTLVRQLGKCMTLMDRQMAGEIPDPENSAAQAWVGLRKLKGALVDALARQDKVKAYKVVAAPTVREARGR